MPAVWAGSACELSISKPGSSAVPAAGDGGETISREGGCAGLRPGKPPTVWKPGSMKHVVSQVMAVRAALLLGASASGDSGPCVGSDPLVSAPLDLTSNEILSEFGRLKPPENKGGYFIWGKGIRHFLTKDDVDLEADFELETESEFELNSPQFGGGTFEGVGWRNCVAIVKGVFPLSLEGGGNDAAVMYGGWPYHSWFFTYLTGEAADGAAGTPSAFGWSIGATTESLPADGSAVWRGVMLVGETERRELLLGDAVVTVDFGAANVDIAFTDIRDTDTGARRADIRY